MKSYATTKIPEPISLALLGEARQKATEWSRKHPALGYRKPKAFNRRTRSEAWPAYMLTHENVLSMVVNRTSRRYRKFIVNLRIEQRFRHRANGWRH